MGDEIQPEKAKTLGGLINKIQHAIYRYGTDARWLVNMDGGISILDNRAEIVMLIEP